jgi:hypothetical protein
MFPVDIAARHPELAATRLFTPDQWADYLLYANYPRQKVFYDDRAFYGEKMYRDVNALLSAQPDSLMPLDRDQTTRVLIQTSSPLSKLLSESPAWQEIDHDTTAELFARR